MSSLELFSQIVNIERQRVEFDTTGWIGSIYITLDARRNSSNVFSLSTGSNLFYRGENYSWMILGEYALIRAGSTSFSNELFTHLRHGYDLTTHIHWESFFQIQQNRLTNLDFRALVGTGARFRLTDYDNAQFYWGTFYMFERDETSNPQIGNSHHRISSYFSFSLFPQDDVSFISTTYIQPRLDLWSDYRIQTESSLGLSITNKLSLGIRITLSYDAVPPEGIPGLTYSFLNGLSYNFN